MRLVLRSKRRIRARVSTPARKRPYSTSAPLFISKLFTLIEDSIYKRRSTGDTKVALTDTIYEKVRSSFFPAAIRFALKPEKGRSCYLCNYGLCWPLFRSSTLFSLLCSIESYQTRLTSDQPAKGCEVGPGTKNESISVYGTEVAGRRPLNCSSAIQWWLVPIRQGYNAWSKVQYSR